MVNDKWEIAWLHDSQLGVSLDKFFWQVVVREENKEGKWINCFAQVIYIAYVS